MTPHTQIDFSRPFVPLLCLHVLPFAVAQFQTVPAPPPPPDPNSESSSRFNPFMGMVMVLLVIAFFLMGFCSVYIRRCAQRRLMGAGFDFDPSVNFGLRRATVEGGGLDAAVIESFPTFVYSEVKGLKIGNGSLECAVCLSEFEDDETLRFIPKCSHVFHTDCIDSWLSSHSTCPVCRAYLVPKPGDLSVPYTRFQISAPETGSETSEPGLENIGVDEPGWVGCEAESRDRTESPRGKLIRSNTNSNRRRPPRSRSSGWRLTGLFPRSHSTGHSLVQLGDDIERFTLKLPEEVRSRLMNSTLNRTRSCVVFSSAMSSRRGYRNGGVNHFRYQQFDPENRLNELGCMSTSPFFSRIGSVHPSKPESGSEPATTNRKDLFKPIKLPFGRLLRSGENNDGERSSDRLKPDGD